MADEDEDTEDQNADGAEQGAEGEEGEGKKKKSKKKLLLLLLVLLLLGGGGAGVYLSGILEGGPEMKQSISADKVVYYSMPEMIINLSAPGKQASFLKATVILELDSTLDAVTVETNLPRLMDSFNTYVRELRPSDLSGTAGITRLREELLLRANKALEPTEINNVLFKEIVVQ